MHSMYVYCIPIELMINKTHGLSPPGGLVSPSGGFASLLFDQVGHFASIKLCLVLSHQGAIIKIPVVRCHYLLCLGPQLSLITTWLCRRHLPAKYDFLVLLVMSDTIIQQSEFFHTHVYTVLVSYYVDDDFSSFTFKNMFESCQIELRFFLKEQIFFVRILMKDYHY